MIFQNREDAGKKLAKELLTYKNKKDTIVIGLVRGGVVVAAHIAKELHLPLDVLIVRKIGAPNNPELALGAISEKGSGVFNERLITHLGVSKEYIQKEIEHQREIIKKRKQSFFKGKKPFPITDKNILLVDDGIATGASMKVAVESIRFQNAKKIVIATPVAAQDSLKELSSLVDEVVCLTQPVHFYAVGAFYRDFKQVSDEEVLQIMQT